MPNRHRNIDNFIANPVRGLGGLITAAMGIMTSIDNINQITYDPEEK